MFHLPQFYFNRSHMQSYQLPVKRMMMTMMQKSIKVKVNKVNSLPNHPSSLPSHPASLHSQPGLLLLSLLPAISPHPPPPAPWVATGRRRWPRVLLRRRSSSPPPRRFRARRGWWGMWRLFPPWEEPQVSVGNEDGCQADASRRVVRLVPTPSAIRNCSSSCSSPVSLFSPLNTFSLVSVTQDPAHQLLQVCSGSSTSSLSKATSTPISPRLTLSLQPSTPTPSRLNN